MPADTPEITPELLIVAIAGSELVQVPPETVEVKVVVEPIQISCVPLSVPAHGVVAREPLTSDSVISFKETLDSDVVCKISVEVFKLAVVAVFHDVPS